MTRADLDALMEKSRRAAAHTARAAVNVALNALVYDAERSAADAWAMVDRLRADAVKLRAEIDDWKARALEGDVTQARGLPPPPPVPADGADKIVNGCIHELNVPKDSIVAEVARLVARPDQNTNRLRIEELEREVKNLKKAQPRGDHKEAERKLRAIEQIADDARAVLVAAGEVEVLGGEDDNGLETKVHNLRAFIRQRFGDGEKPARPSSSGGASAPGPSATPAASSVTASSSPPAASLSAAAATEADPFVIMRTIPSGRQIYSEREARFVPVSERDIFRTYAEAIDAEADKRVLNLRRCKVVPLSVALAPPAAKTNQPRVEMRANADDEGPFVVCAEDGTGKRAWLTTSQGLMPEAGAGFAAISQTCEENSDPIAEFELLEEAAGAAADLTKAMPNAGGTCVVVVHDVGALVVAEEKGARRPGQPELAGASGGAP